MGLGLCHLRQRGRGPAPLVGPLPAPKTAVDVVHYGDFSDVWRDRWTWDRVAKGTHTRANCISACSWDVFVKDGIA
ncbi:MAG: hypothetical protein JRG85_17595, partial [Deltaproteobacteria bacterium]|nr:hypothetical protein [Deltaproteobacteria bacterium]